MRKIITCLMLACMLLCSFILSSCSSFFEEETLMIEDVIVSEQLEPDGSTKITIKYVDNVKPDDIFYIPQGIKGDVGPAVDIKADYDENNNLVITIDDLNDKTEDPSYTIYRGTKVTRVSDKLEIDNSDPNNPQYYFTIFYEGEDGEERPENVYFPMPKDGATLIVEVKDINNDGNKWLVFSYDDGREGAPEPILIPKGENGTSIKGIEYVIDSKDRTKYNLIITYELADGSTYTESTPIEAPGTWITSEGKPTEEFGRVGDFCWDKQNNKIYYKKSSYEWEPMFDFDVTKGDPYVVKFILNDNNSGEASFPTGFESGEVSINPLSSFYQDEKAIPIPTWPGHTFLGWYATREGNNIDPRIHGQLTNLTTITGNMTVYALWD